MNSPRPFRQVEAAQIALAMNEYTIKRDRWPVWINVPLLLILAAGAWTVIWMALRVIAWLAS